ncbi:hypothetical protein EJP67_28820 [Variovorax guangxiensis]|uniref:Serine protease n=1 Tax=Variovorax guangxiensis TaxID=1775474 RepID=A0A3S0ZSD4_9BURK|nr:hypothetical protein [Variovorax guangxiensis]RUR71064.1 hypothetical protein EJP67_28820 [Variovorax guangxiensis]
MFSYDSAGNALVKSSQTQRSWPKNDQCSIGGSKVELDSVRELKALAVQRIVEPMIESVVTARFARAASDLKTVRNAQPERFMALGVSQHPTSKEYRLAIRLQRRSLLDRPELTRLTEMARGEIDIKFVGRIQKRAALSWEQRRHRPLKIGISVGHRDITAGTLGCFVQRAIDGEWVTFILSNNHVLAKENLGVIGDAVLQPGRLDNGTPSKDKVAELSNFIPLKKRHNLVDCAIAKLGLEGAQYDSSSIRGLGKLAGLASAGINEGARVAKLGRTTGLTKGRVTAFELDDVVVAYEQGNLSFDQTIEIEGIGARPFSDGGDSGSLIVNSRNEAVALLFAGSESGGRNNAGLTYANPIHDVLKALKVELIC